jgi:tripartite-type tricarboxylate transporter receptor subunit TctC
MMRGNTQSSMKWHFGCKNERRAYLHNSSSDESVSGMTRALAMTTARRSTVLPDVPTLAEGAIPGFDVGTWFGLLAPANTAPSIVEKLNRQVVEIVNSPEARARMLDLGAEPVGNSSVEMAAQINKELETFGALTKQLQLVVD